MIMREARSLALENIDDDTFEHKTKCNDWRNHVPDSVVDVWNICLILKGRLLRLLRLFADQAASAEG